MEKLLEERFIRGLRRVFEFDDQFRYNVNDKATRIVIAPDYPKGEVEQPFKTPQILVSGISFNVQTQMGLSNNLQEDVAHAGITNYAQRHFFRTPFSANFICLGEYDISRNLANRVFYYISFRAYDYFSSALNLNIENVAKGTTDPRDQYPEPIFQTPVSIQGFTAISKVQTPFNYLDGGVSKPIDRLGETFVDIKIEKDIN